MLDFEKVDKMVENCKKLYPDIPDYCLWVLACDYYLKEGKEEDDDEDNEEAINRKKEALEAYEKAKKELENTKCETIKVV